MADRAATTATTATTAPAAAWLVLLYQVPARSSSVRVRIWRRLQDTGAVQLRQAAYVLPNHAAQREDFEWLKSEIVGLGGQATVMAADALDGFAHDEIVEQFRVARARDVAAVGARAERLLKQVARAGDRPLAHTVVGRRARALIDEWRALAAITFFDTPGSAVVEDLVQKIARSAINPVGPAPPATGALDRAAYARRRWVTRPRPGVDRMASAWLIRRYLDPEARFDFAERPTTDAVPFDMFGVEFGHQGDACTFEVLARRFAIDDPAVLRIGRVVHDLDLRDGRFGEPETAGIGLLVEGLRHAHPDDRELLERGIALFESLARAVAGRTPDAASGRARRRAAPSPGSKAGAAARRTRRTHR